MGANFEARKPSRDMVTKYGSENSFSRQGLTAVAYKNNTKIGVTDRRIYGSDSTIVGSGLLRFQVPYNETTGDEPAAAHA
jgi:hypothetical protein